LVYCQKTCFVVRNCRPSTLRSARTTLTNRFSP